jgi:diamine N-acetyltransferase
MAWAWALLLAVVVLGLLAAVAVAGPRLAAAVRRHGLAAVWGIFTARTRILVELIRPRTVWGERIGLRSVARKLSDADVERLYRWDHDDDIRRWNASNIEWPGLVDLRAELRRTRWRPQFSDRTFYIVLRGGELIGRIGLYRIDWKKGEGALAVFLDKAYWGQQYGREAVVLFEAVIFRETPLTRIILATTHDNLRAQRTFAACGFRVVGSSRRPHPLLDREVDYVLMEVTRADLESGPAATTDRGRLGDRTARDL